MASPLPQAIDPGRWRIVPGAGSVILAARVMSVPMDASEAAALVRAHEMAHVRYSPRKPRVPGRHQTSYLFAEDGRIGILATKAGVATTPHVDTVVVEGASPRIRGRIVLALQGSERATWMPILESLEPQHRDIASRAIEKLRTEVTHARSAYDAACIIDRLPGRDVRLLEGVAEADEWGEMFHERASLHRTVLHQASRRPRPDEAGARLAFPHRYFVDGRIFSRRERRRGGHGTILIDGSSSMQWTVQDLDELLLSVPALRAAVYAGTRDLEAGIRKFGYLRIIADDGAAADASELLSPNHGTGNVVDFPALQWLSEQPGPRVWYSDGQVTGRGDYPVTRRLREQLESLLLAAGIHRCTTLAEALEWMTNRSGRA